MLYYETDDKRGKIIGAAAVLAYFIIVVLLMLLVKFSFDLRDTGEGILINFGDVESASGSADPSLNTATAQRQQQVSQSNTAPDEILTQNVEDAPEVRQPDRQRQTRPSETSQPNPTTSQTQTVQQEQPRQVNPNALFPGRTEGSSSTSEGTAATGTGNQGVPEGSPLGSHEGTGTGAGGTGFDLAGRSVVGALPKPDYGANKQGRVMIEIVVDAAGVIKSATFRARGSTTSDSELVNAALKAARQSRFNKIDGDALQTGTITYNFTLK